MILPKPKAVFFDFGGTLSAGTSFDPGKAGLALYACADNPEACSPEEAVRVWKQVFAESVSYAETTAKER